MVSALWYYCGEKKEGGVIFRITSKIELNIKSISSYLFLFDVFIGNSPNLLNTDESIIKSFLFLTTSNGLNNFSFISLLICSFEELGYDLCYKIFISWITYFLRFDKGILPKLFRSKYSIISTFKSVFLSFIHDVIHVILSSYFPVLFSLHISLITSAFGLLQLYLEKITDSNKHYELEVKFGTRNIKKMTQLKLNY